MDLGLGYQHNFVSGFNVQQIVHLRKFTNLVITKTYDKEDHSNNFDNKLWKSIGKRVSYGRKLVKISITGPKLASVW